MASGGDRVSDDDRVQWLAEIIHSHFRAVKADKYQKFVSSDAFLTTAQEFCDADHRTLLLVGEKGSSLSITLDPPKSINVNTLYVFKIKAGVLPMEGFASQCLVGDMIDPLRHLRQLVEDVYEPLLSNPANQEGWSEVVSQDVLERVHTFLSDIQISIGQTIGETALPLPTDEDARPGTSTKDRVHVLEGCIITWTAQIKSVLKLDSEKLLSTMHYPGPLVELDFWEAKAHNLNSIFEQLQGDRVRKVLRFLDGAKSTYNASFAKLCREVFHARVEANDTVRFLTTLRTWLTQFEDEATFEGLAQFFRPMMHTLMLVWKHSRFYNTPARLVVIVREICNSLVRKACEHVSGAAIFDLVDEERPGDAVELLMKTLRVCGVFKSTYFDYKAKVAVEAPHNPWRVQNSAMFSRLDSFLERCHDIREFTTTIVQFSKLAKVEIGGTKGKTLTTSVAQVYQDFNAAVEAFKSVKYDVMDVDAKVFDDDFYEFRQHVKELERRLASVLTQGFDDTPTIIGRFKLLDSFSDGLLERPLVREEMERKHQELLASYAEDLSTVQSMFVDNRDRPPISYNLPPIAGALSWCRGLLGRIQVPMEKLKALSRSVLDREEAKPVIKLYTTMVAMMAEYEHNKIVEWGKHIEKSSQAKLKLPLIAVDPKTSMLRVNFDPALVRLLREVKYFLLLGLRVPDTALAIYKKAETFRKHTGNLDLIVNTYNNIQQALLPVERPLMKPYLAKVDKALAAGVKTLNWKAHGIDLFITEAMNVVNVADDVLATMTSNLKAAQALLDEWSAEPLFTRRAKPLTCEAFDSMVAESAKGRHRKITEGGRAIAKLLKDTNRKVKVSAGMADWKNYVDFVSNIVISGLHRVCAVSLTYLRKQIDAEVIRRDAMAPIIEIEMDLYGKEVMYIPDMAPTGVADGVPDRINGWVDAIFRSAVVITRLDIGNGNYLREMLGHPDNQWLMMELGQLVDAVREECDALRKNYTKYSYLWTSDLNAMFDEFIEKAHAYPPEDEPPDSDSDAEEEYKKDREAQRAREEEALAKAKAEAKAAMGDGDAEAADGDEDEDDGPRQVRVRVIDLEAFDARIREYREVQAEIEALKASTDVVFVRVDSQPIKQALSTWVTKWVYVYTSYLHDHVMERLTWLHDFTEEVEAGLDPDVTASEADRERLLAVVSHIRNVRRVMDETALMFEPLKGVVALLKNHGDDFQTAMVAGAPALQYLDQAQLVWENCVNHTFKVKETIRPHQNQMADNIKTDIAAFTGELASFRTEFLTQAPFDTVERWEDRAYEGIDDYETRLSEMERRGQELRHLEELFELQVSEHSDIEETREDMVQLKTVWDMFAFMSGVFDSWRSTLWADIRADDLLDETKKLQKQVKGMPSKVRQWPIHKHMTATAANMATVLPLVQDLRSPALRDRHWKALMAVTGKTIEKDHTFCLEDVLGMKLHLHVEDVRDICEVANKELKIENRLRNIEGAWGAFTLEFVPYKGMEDVKVLVTPDEAIENLEEHMMQLQTMIGMGKFVDYFRERVERWQEQLGNVDSVLLLWLGVQRQWAALEAIFMGSADIRSQLPEDSKRFEGIDQDFKDLMKEAENAPNIVDACGVDGRDERLRNAVAQLELCQKSLNEYLDMKKKIFPRFYFVSNQALLDILSNGNDPVAIMPHIGACFDAIGELYLMASQKGTEEKPAPLDTAVSMVAKDGEIVPFSAPYTIKGAVEVWLTQLVAVMQDNLKMELDKALDMAALWESDTPREHWLTAYPAQIALLASQVVWTEETEAALEEFESGQDDAVKSYLTVCVTRLEALIKQVLSPLDADLRTKIITLITIDVHSRDVVQHLIDKKTSSPVEFMWQSQLRYYWQEGSKDVTIRITDFRTWYCYEYIGNVGRLVITPLTDRCYITLTMAMRLMLGGAPAGPAGTGKTETTKDLARGLGLPCYVFNCSDQMNYQTMADIFKGLAQTGAWGCFDEFNRIPIEVLSVVATQVETVLAAIRFLSLGGNRPDHLKGLPEGRPPAVVGSFDFMGDPINLVPTVGFFITMNPGYAGRTELPENLKALFRSCAMIRPDLALICENMLMSEGFVHARPLSVKFVTLYQLSSELLSPQHHYDWGLRAVKSVLRVAGMLRRAEPDQLEEAVLMRALRDFNTPKIVARDIPVFLRLVRDLFPGVDLDPKVNVELREKAAAVCKRTGLQPEETFLLKVEQYQELLDVRHSVMLVGPAGAGKTSIWKTLIGTLNTGHNKPVAVYEVVNPKSVSSDELYGYMTLAKDWKDGVLSIIMRNMSKHWSPYNASQTAKWVVLDGDIDAEWIESMNTVMDDNKVLTLVSNERIPLTPAMRMIFEIASLANATPATVSRAGILFVNESDIGWRPLVESWIQMRPEAERAQLPRMFTRYVEKTLDLMAANKFAHVTPLRPVNMVQSVCRLLDGLLAQDEAARTAAGDDVAPELLEHYFVFAAMWAFGGALSSEAPNNYKKAFSNMWRSEFKAVKFPDDGLIFDYFFSPPGKGDDPAEPVFVRKWADNVGDFVPADTDVNDVTVPTVDGTRLSYLMGLCVDQRVPVMFVGPAGTGKTQLVREFLAGTPEDVTFSTINMNFYTDSMMLQRQLEDPIDKRSGKIYGPPGNTRHIYFVDDMNMPFVETYGTQTPIALLRQFADYRSWFDRAELGLKREIRDVQMVGAMNPKAGSFTINPRLQRHFVTLAVVMPDNDDLKLIYQSILDSHLYSGFNNDVMRMSGDIVAATINLRAAVSAQFLPSAVKFHYNFNMRDLANVFRGLTLATPTLFKRPVQFVRLWLHECARVFSDRLVSEKDIQRFDNLIVERTKKYFDLEHEAMFAQPNLYTGFITHSPTGEPVYAEVADKKVLHTSLVAKLKEYNDSNSIMDLVLFEQAMEHVCRIARIIMSPRGNALLVGVGGSGKQSLCKLAASICGYAVSQLSISSQFTVADLKEALKDMYRKAGVKPGEPLVFLLTDQQIIDEQFLVFVNDLLSSGVIADLFAPDEFDALFSALRAEAKASGIPDSRQHMMDFFIDRVRQNLHVVLCFSPVGEAFRQRARKFPALITCTAIDWFHAWPRDALVSVAASFLGDVELPSEEVREGISHHMAEVHLSVTAVSAQFFTQQRRHNHVTPKSFLELISFYKSFLGDRRKQSRAQIERLSTGLSTLQRTAKDVEQLQEDLKGTMVRVAEKKANTEELLEQMGKERGEAQAQAEIAAGEREKADKAAAEASKIEKEAEGELAVAKPALEEAQHAVDCLDKASLTELKSLSKPPAGVDKVTTCVLMMIKGEKRNFSWDNAKKMMGKIDHFKGQLETFKAQDMSEDLVSKLDPYVEDADFTAEKMATKSSAASNLCAWVVNSVRYNKIYKKVEPLMIRLAAAQDTKAAADAMLATVEAKLAEVQERLAALQKKFLDATNEKTRVEEEAAACEERLNLAERLVGGLSSENERWGNEIHTLRLRGVTLVGDVLLAAAFVSYVGAFDAQFREALWKREWAPDLLQREIPTTEGVDPLSMLCTDAMTAEWMNEGLPADRISLENGAIVINSKRWPLIIDPQLQGITWLRMREEAQEDRDLMILRTSQKGWMKRVITAVSSGATVIIENLGESVDAALDPILARDLVRSGKQFFMRIGDEDVEYDPGFRLYLQTKLSNPHFKPELQAQCTLINFIVTEKGLEDQLLAHVVAREQPELEEEMMELQLSFNRYKIQLLELEDQLLERLANAPDDILSDVPLIEGLEATKAKVMDINDAVKRGKETEESVMEAREVYRPVATEGALLYFILIQLCVIAHMYQFSLASFVHFFFKAMDKAEDKDLEAERVTALSRSVRFTIFTWASRGLFEEHKLIFQSQLVFQLLKGGVIGEESGYSPEALVFLVRGASAGADEDNEIPWLPDAAWNAACALSEQEHFGTFATDLAANAPRFMEWFNHVTPESEKLPLDWRELDRTPFLKLLVIRALRPDRMATALSRFAQDMLPDGVKYVECDAQLNSYQILEEAALDASPETPIYFILSPGSDIVSNVERMARANRLEKGVSYFNISLGQGQDIVAMRTLETAFKEGHWVLLNNVHLMPRWLVELEKVLDQVAMDSGMHADFRLFLSSDPSTGIPIGLLSRSIKLTDEPPTGLKANLKRAFCSFSAEELDEMDSRTRGVLFGLCHFHALMLERKKFGPQGFNMMYPFAGGDLLASAVVLRNYMESAATTPWEDLRYLFGQIMYGGHIVNDFDRLLCMTYLEFFMRDELLDEMELFPYAENSKSASFKAPPLTSYSRYLAHIDENLTVESPIAFGMHPNAEIGFRTEITRKLFATIQDLQPAEAASSDGSQSVAHVAGAVMTDLLDQYSEFGYDIDNIRSLMDEPGPFQTVFLQECEAMNGLVHEMVRSLQELELGIKGELTMSDPMEALMNSLYMDRVPATWAKLAYPSLRPLGSWLVDLAQRWEGLTLWTEAPMDVPLVCWLGGLFNPQSFLTAIMQTTAQRDALELDKLVIVTEVTKKNDDEIEAPARDGAYIGGLKLEGARWDMVGQNLEESRPKEMFCPMPVVNCRAAMPGKERSGMAPIPVYKTQQRGPTYVFTASLRTKAVAAKWVLAGVVLVMETI